MFKALFLATLIVTLVVNIIFLFATKDKPPDLSTSTFVSISRKEDETSSQRRLFLRSNEFYDYSSAAKVSFLNSSQSIQTNIHDTNKQNSLDATELNLGDEQEFNVYDDDQEVLFTSQNSSINSQKQMTTPVPYISGKRNHNRQLIKPSLMNKLSYLLMKRGEIEILSAASIKSENHVKKAVDYNTIDDSTVTPSKGSHQFNDIKAISQQSESVVVKLNTTQNPTSESSTINHDERKQRDQSILSTDYNSKILDIRVKSSRNHVFISVDDIIIYESKSNKISLPNNRIKLNNSPSTNDNNKGLSREILTSSPSTISDDADSSDGRGIHVVVLNEYNGYVMAKRIFDTYSPQQDEELCFFINMIRDGRILIFAIKDEGSFKMPLSSQTRILIQKLGSSHIMDLRWRDMWAFVVRKTTLLETNNRLGQSIFKLRKPNEQVNLAEGLSKSSRFSDWGPPVIIETKVELVEPKFKSSRWGDDTSSGCEWNSGNKEEDERRLNFCSRIEGYGRVCDCNSPALISFNQKKIENSQIDQIPIVVMASNRPYYLYRMLRSLLAADGVNSSMITVFIDGYYDEPLMVSKLFDLRAVQKKPLAQRSARISHHYKSSLTATFNLFPEAEHAILFEEDLDIAQDTLVYFNQTLKLLKRDSSLYCISAWNDQGYEHTAYDNSLLYRIETMPGLGWMLSRKLFKEELEPNWPSTDQPHDWDMWIRTQSIRKNRECIIPDISRTFHFGSMGTNINSYFQRQYFSKHAFNLVPQKKFANLDKMYKGAYEELIENLIQQGHVLGHENKTSIENSTDYLCSLANTKDVRFLASSLTSLKEQRRKSLIDLEEETAINNVIYIDMIDKNDFVNWLKLAKCWRIWDLDARGQHNSMWRLFLNGQPYIVIGFPASPYSQFKPKNVKPFRLL